MKDIETLVTVVLEREHYQRVQRRSVVSTSPSASVERSSTLSGYSSPVVVTAEADTNLSSISSDLVIVTEDSALTPLAPSSEGLVPDAELLHSPSAHAWIPATGPPLPQARPPPARVSSPDPEPETRPMTNKRSLADQQLTTKKRQAGPVYFDNGVETGDVIRTPRAQSPTASDDEN